MYLPCSLAIETLPRSLDKVIIMEEKLHYTVSEIDALDGSEFEESNDDYEGVGVGSSSNSQWHRYRFTVPPSYGGVA